MSTAILFLEAKQLLKTCKEQIYRRFIRQQKRTTEKRMILSNLEKFCRNSVK